MRPIVSFGLSARVDFVPMGFVAQPEPGVVYLDTGYTTEPESAQADWDKCVLAVRECAAGAADFGVVLGVQNHHDTGVGVEAYGEFLRDVGHPNCKAMFDPWAPALQGADLRKTARQFAPLMVQTTLADYIKMGMPPAAGIIRRRGWNKYKVARRSARLLMVRWLKYSSG